MMAQRNDFYALLLTNIRVYIYIFFARHGFEFDLYIFCNDCSFFSFQHTNSVQVLAWHLLLLRERLQEMRLQTHTRLVI